MRRSGAPSQRSFSGLLNLPSPKTPVEKVNLGGGSLGVSNSKTNFQPATHGLGSNAGGGMITSEVRDSKSSLTAPGLGSDLLPSRSAQLSSPSTQPVRLGSPTLPNRSPLLQLNRPAAVLRQPSPAGATFLAQNPNPVTVPISTNWSPVMRSSICSNSQSQSEAKKLFPNNPTRPVTPAAAVDTTTNSTSFRCFHNLLTFCDTLFQVLCMCLGQEICSQAQEMGRRWAAARCKHNCLAH